MSSTRRRSLLGGALASAAAAGVAVGAAWRGADGDNTGDGDQVWSWADGRPRPGVEGVLRLLDATPVVALTEGAHGSQDIYDFLSVVMLHPGFAVVDAVVVEWGNSLYQAVADDYVNGGMVRLSQLQRIWRNTTQSPANPLEHPTHHRLLSLARAINLFAGRPRPLRVLLADPPIDWTTITSADEYERSYHGVSRTDAWTGVILDEVMAKRQHCLTIGGGFHLMRGGYSLMGLDQPNVTDRIERHGHAVSVIHTHASAIAGRAGEIEQHLAGWARPAIATAAHASIGRVRATDVFETPLVISGDRTPQPRTDLSLADLVDYVLHIGLRRDQSLSVPLWEVFYEPTYWSELNRRRKAFPPAFPIDLDTWRHEHNPALFP